MKHHCRVGNVGFSVRFFNLVFENPCFDFTSDCSTVLGCLFETALLSNIPRGQAGNFAMLKILVLFCLAVLDQLDAF